MATALDGVYARWRTIEGEAYSTGGDRFNPPALDCSGGVVFANRPFVPWLQSGNSASMAQYAVDHRLTKSLAARRPGDLVIYDKYGVATQSNGSRGHIGQVSENGAVTWECASSRGCQRYSYARLGWCMCVDMSRWLGGASQLAPEPNVPSAVDREAYRRFLEAAKAAFAAASNTGEDDDMESGVALVDDKWHTVDLEGTRALHVYPGGREWLDEIPLMAPSVPVPPIASIFGVRPWGHRLIIFYKGVDGVRYSLGHDPAEMRGGASGWHNTSTG